MKSGSKRRRGPAKPYRRAGTKFWWIRPCYRGTPYPESTKTTSWTRACEVLRERQHEMDTGKFSEERNVTVDDILADYLRSRRKLASFATMEQHSDALLDVVSGTCGQRRRSKRLGQPTPETKYGAHGLHNVLARHVTTRRLDRLAERWEAKGLSIATINRRMGTLISAFHDSQNGTPPRVVSVPRWRKGYEGGNVRQGFVEYATMLAILPAIPDEDVRDFCEWSFWCGMRKGTVARLEWKHFDSENWTLELPGVIMKNRKPYRLKLVGGFRDVIARRLKRRRLDCRHIFYRIHKGAPTGNVTPGQPKPIYEFRKMWKTGCRAGRVPDLLFHDMRRSAARNLYKAVGDKRLCCLIMGLRTESIFDRYNITTDEDLVAAAQKLTAFMKTLPTTSPEVPMKGMA